MGLGTVLAQMINILAQPILTRLFPEETLGVYTYIVSLATIVIPVASLKLDMLIVSEPEEKESQYITDVCLYINILVMLVYFVVITIGYLMPGENVFNKYGAVIFIVPFLVLTNGIRFLFISYNNRYKRYKLISVVAIIREAVRAVVQVVAGVLKYGVLSLSFGYLISPVFGLRRQMEGYLEKLKSRKLANRKKTKDIIFNKGKKQILYLVPAQFINSFSASLITISITALFSAKVLGYYSAGIRILDIPIVFITANVSKVCYQRISENVAQNKPVLKLLMSVIAVLSLISFCGFAVLYFIAPRLSAIVFGNNYEVAGYYIRCLCAMYAIRLIATSFAGIYTVFKKQNFELILNILLIMVAAISYFVCRHYSLEITSYLKIICGGYSIVYAIMLIGYIVCCFQYDKEVES